MIRSPRRLAPALAALAALASLAPSGQADVYAGAAVVDTDVYHATVNIPGGKAYVRAYVVRHKGASAHAGEGVPDAGPTEDTYVFGCVTLDRGKAKDSGCSDIDPASVSTDPELSAERMRFVVPSFRYPKGTIRVDLTLAATGEMTRQPGYDVYQDLPEYVDLTAGLDAGRTASATGSVVSSRAGGGKVASTADGRLGRDQWVSVHALNI